MSLFKILGFAPNDIQIYELALVHKSSPLKLEENKWANNERLEYLGDAILDAVVADILYKQYPTKREGFLTNTRSKIVQRETLDQLAIKIGLDKLVIYSAKLCSHSNHLYGNALEAFIGAIYLDQGYDKTYQFIRDRLIKRHLNVEELIRKEVNFKSNLIEWSQKNKASALASPRKNHNRRRPKWQSRRSRPTRISKRKSQTSRRFKPYPGPTDPE